MKEIADYIKKLYNSLSDGENQPIDSSNIAEAIKIITNFQEQDSNTLFYLLSAANLLNAAIKVKEHTSQLCYGFSVNENNVRLCYAIIKSRVSRAADNILSNSKQFPDVSVYYSINEKCIYFKVLGVVFSFHQVPETVQIKLIASRAKPIVWSGIRLQRIAQNVYLCARKII